MTQTPRSNRLHIALFGRRNSGKSTLINALTGHETAVTSPVPGTTTDPVYKSMEIYGLGPCVLIDTAGFDDEGSLGELRVERTRDVTRKTDIALMVFAQDVSDSERMWMDELKKKGCPVIPVVNRMGGQDTTALEASIREAFHLTPVVLSALDRDNVPALLDAMRRALPPDWESPDLIRGLATEGDLVLLVMPQDIQAPKGRLILPQVQVTRALLDKGCVIVSVTADKLEAGLSALGHAPDLMITDSQVFPLVYEKKPPETRLTSFSVLMARNKGDIQVFVEGAQAIDRLMPSSKVLIAEACTHAPLQEDIGRVKLPRLLRKKVGDGLRVDMVSGPDFPQDLSGYDLIIHCGACMFNRKYVLSRLEKAQAANVPITNYGVALAKLAGILDRVDYGAE